MNFDPAHDAAVAAKFDEEAVSWRHKYDAQAPGGEAMLGRLARFRAALIEHVPPPARVLDFGCGTGELTRFLTKEGWHVTGCDVSANMIDVARGEAPDLPWHLLDVGSNRPLPFQEECFDAVVASSVFEYLSEPKQTLERIAAIMRPKGVLLFTVPDPRDPTRKRETILRAGARVWPVREIVKRTRWRHYFAYLRLSINHWPLERWTAVAAITGLVVNAAPAPSGSLVLLTAVKR